VSRFNELNRYLRNRPFEIKRAKEQGVKVVAYTPGEYLPQELIHAAGCIPLCLIRGGDPEPVTVSGAYVPQFLCAFSRAQLGYRLLNEDFYYQAVDRLITAVTCQHIRRMGDLWAFYTDVEEFRFGVPRNYTFDSAFRYYHEGLLGLKGYLEALTGTEIDDKRISASIKIHNRIRQLFRKISRFRKERPPKITGKEFIQLHHASFSLDAGDMIQLLETVLKRLNSGETEAMGEGGPRVMLIGPNLAMGDYNVLDLLENSGADVVAEDFCEGIRHYWTDVDEDDSDPLLSLSKSYYLEKIPCVYMISAMKRRFDHLSRLADGFQADGIIWYHLKYCETYSLEGFYTMNRFREMGMPVLKISSEYDMAERGQNRTSVEAFVEMLRDKRRT
jgi:benzoyl-CoA reductase/2-hydroxyglutaryl-CoA dehydratase subunit BcrC/BadD/HgdB